MGTEIKLLEMMGRKGIRTIQELHESTNIARSLISNILKGKGNVTVKTLERLCDVLECDMHELVVYKKKEEGE